MQKTQFHKQLHLIIELAECTINSVKEGAPTLGYRERVQIERCLFLLLKWLCKNRINYNLQGFSNEHIEALLRYCENNINGNQFFQTIEKAFQLKIFIAQVSCENGYVRGDSKSKLGLTDKSFYSFIDSQFRRLSERINLLMVNS
jgi:hypothetical protein